MQKLYEDFFENVYDCKVSEGALFARHLFHEAGLI